MLPWLSALESATGSQNIGSTVVSLLLFNCQRANALKQLETCGGMESRKFMVIKHLTSLLAGCSRGDSDLSQSL